MKRTAIAAALLLMGGAAYAYSQRRAVVDVTPPDTSESGGGWWESVTSEVQHLVSEVQQKDETMNTIQAAGDADRNISAFLETIARAEGTAQRSDPYRVCFGYRHTVVSFKEHPAVSGEWKGERLPDDQCRAAGYGPGCVSTAAGKYQIIKPTWASLKTRLKLPDFGPASQDRAAIQLLADCGALVHVKAGNFDRAISAARRTWASLPGAGYAQPERSMSFLQTVFLNSGGWIA